MWKVCSLLSLIVFLGTIVMIFAVSRRKDKNKYATPLNLLLCGIFLTSVILYFPVYFSTLDGHFIGVKSFLAATHDTLQIFSLNSDYFAVYVEDAFSGSVYYDIYHLLSSLLFVVAPIAFFGFALSFFKNFSAYRKFLLRYGSEVYAFSELNERSYLLGKDLLARSKGIAVVYANAFCDDVEKDLSDEAMQMGAICFKKDISEIRFRLHKNSAAISFLLMGENDDRNCYRALALTEAYGDRDRTRIYVFARGDENEAMISSMDKRKIKVRRIDTAQAFVYRYLYDHGFGLFQNAVPTENGEKKISVALVGDGSYACDFFKALPFFCQMDGYVLELHVFTADALFEERWAFRCPELLDEKHNGVKTEGEPFYRICVHKVDSFDSRSFAEEINGVAEISDVFVLCDKEGDADLNNLKIAMDLRSLFEKRCLSPAIHCVMSDPYDREILTDLKNFRGQKYDIDLIGMADYIYTESVIFGSEPEKDALARHLKWGSEDVFWHCGYHYRSSMASAIHHKMKILCGIPGADLPLEDRDEAQKRALRMLEHNRWNAYMRSEGYSYHPVRNDLAKHHPCLVPFHQLPEEEQAKDDD